MVDEKDDAPEGDDSEYEEELEESPACGVSVRELWPHNHLRMLGGPNVLVMFYSDYCDHCHETMPALRTASMYLCRGVKVMLACVDRDGISDYAQNTLKVEGLPTLVIFKNNVEVARQVGSMTTKEIVEWARKYQ